MKHKHKTDWTPFDFGEVPEGMHFTGYSIVRRDFEGYEVQMDSIPEDAVKTAEPNHWRVKSTPGCYDVIVAIPHYEFPKPPRIGDCAKCAIKECGGHYEGRKCWNYRPL